MTELRFRLLGPPELIRGDQPAVFKTRKALALLAYLALEKRPHPREKVADLLWPMATAEHARSSLRMTTQYVRGALGEAAESVLLATRDAIGLAPSARLDLDVSALSRARQQIRMPGGTHGARIGVRQEVQHAVSLYRGSFLGDLVLPDAPEFDAWLAGQRAHWLGLVSELLDWLSAVQMEADESRTTLATLERWVSIDPGEEIAWQRLMELHLAQGNRVGARQTWSAYRRALADLGIEPSRDLETIGSQLAAGFSPDHATGHHAQRGAGAAVASPRSDEPDLVQALFVGRGRELLQLRRALERVRAGEPEVVILEGEAGSGKTRLAHEFLTWAASQGVDVVRSRGYETTVDLPFVSLIEGLRGRLERENAPDDLLDDPWLAELSRLLPELRVRYPDLPPPTADPALGRHQLFEAVTRLLKAFADRRPLVVFRDDWHWSDSNSRDLMRYALRRWSEDQARVLVILAVSSEHLGTDRLLAQWMGGLERDAPTTRVGLERLTESDIVLWMAALAGTDGEGSFTDAAASRLGSWLIERAAGNPSQTVAALRTLLEQQVLSFRQSEDGSWMLDLSGLPKLSAALPMSVAESLGSLHNRRQDWGDAPDGRLLHSRRAELNELERWILTDRCREVAVLGIGGIGKTALAAHLARDVAPHFEFVFWRSLRNALPFDEWLTDAVRTLSEQQQVALPENQEERILLLLDLLRAHRCLVVLDNVETVLQPGRRDSMYVEEYAAYGLVLQRVAEVDHQSCLLLTSREKPLEVGRLEGEMLVIRSFHLMGLDGRGGRALLQHKHLDGADKEWDTLVERYAGNPLALQMVGETIGDVFAGEIAPFLQDGVAIFGGIRRLLDAQLNRLSPLEQSLLSWLAIERESIGFVGLIGNLEPPPPRGDALEAIEALQRRSLLEPGRKGEGYTLQPVVLDYVTNRLVSAAVQEIQDGELGTLRTHLLSKAQTKSYIQEIQERLIVARALDRLIAAYGSREKVEQRLLDLLEGLRAQGRRDYAPSNVIKLLQLLRGNLRGLDLTNLSIRQVYLQETHAQDASLAGSELFDCALADAFDSGFSVTFGPDGRHLAVGTFNGEICVWRLAGLERIVATQGHSGVVYGIDWARDGRLLATGGLDGTIKLWEAAQAVDGDRHLRTLEGHTGSVTRLALSADGHLATSGSLDGTVKLWETSTGRLLHTLEGHGGGVWGVALSDDDRVVASASVDGAVKLWDAPTGALLTTLDGRGGGLYAVELTSGGRLVAGGGQDGMVRVWEAATGRPVSILEGHAYQIWSLATSTDGRLLVSGSEDGTVRLWDLASGACLSALEAHTATVTDVAISPDGRLFASVGQDGTLKLWEAPSGKPVATLKGYARGTWALAWDGDGKLLANGTQDGTINLWDVTKVSKSLESGDAPKARFRGHTGQVYSASFGEDGKLLATSSQDNTIRVWRVADGACLRAVSAHDGGVFGLTFSPDARVLISSGQDGLIKLWDVSSGELLTTLQAHAGLIWSIGLGASGNLLVSASQDGTVKLWQVPDGQLLATMRDDGDLFWGVAINREGTLVASGGQSGRVTLWDVTQASGGVPGGRFLATLGAHQGPVWSTAFSRDGRLLASGGLDAIVMLWDLTTRQLVARCAGHDGPVIDVAVSPDGSLVASSSQDGTVMLWHVESGARRAILRPDRQYERMDITAVTGISEVQKMVLRTLGAVERGEG